MQPGGASADRRRRRRDKMKSQVGAHNAASTKVDGETFEVARCGHKRCASQDGEDIRLTCELMRQEDDLIVFVATVNKVYQEVLHKVPPFMRFILIGMQSTGKSTIVERFLKFPMNIVKEGTGTRCPLYVTVIHDESALDPICELSGDELSTASKGGKLNSTNVFELITRHNLCLDKANRFSAVPLYLVVRSNKVQNMMFVDLPGIVSNVSKGIDNRDDVKEILRSEILKPKAKMLVLLEPKEFATNSIIDFIDQSLGGRGNWVDRATFFMTKFDLRMTDSRTGSKTNAFFREFQDNNLIPFLVVTPTLDTEKLEPDELRVARKRLLAEAESQEKKRFQEWIRGIDDFLQHNSRDEQLLPAFRSRIGFAAGVQHLRTAMLQDTAQCLPDVLRELRSQLKQSEAEQRRLSQQDEYRDPKKLQLMASQVLHVLQEKILCYLDGNLQVARKFEHLLQTLDDELAEEEESEWMDRSLNHHTKKESDVRERIARMDIPEHVQAQVPMLGGKQYQRAMQLFKFVMIDHLPEPQGLRKFVPSATGYLNGGLQRENWEHAIMEIIKVSVKEVIPPSINFFVKHVGSILRRLFSIALADVKEGESFSDMFELLPVQVEKYFHQAYDDMIWDLMEQANSATHIALEPTYSTVNPGLSTFASSQGFSEPSQPDGREETYVKRGSTYVLQRQAKEAETGQSWLATWKGKVAALAAGSGEEAKRHMRQHTTDSQLKKQAFLSEQRTAMITQSETDQILQKSFMYIASLMEFNVQYLEFAFNHHLYEGFKQRLRVDFGYRLTQATQWDTLVEARAADAARLQELTRQIQGLRDSLQQVAHLQKRLCS